MKSILKDFDRDNGQTMTVQISESGRVVLSMDGNETNISHYLDIKELRALHGIITSALDERTNQVKEELENE
jgi:hypothetical protein